MAYDGGYQPQQRPYGGPAAQRPGPRGGLYQQGPPQQYNDYQEDYGYEQQSDAGYGPEYGGRYQDPNYARGGPPPNQGYPQQDYYEPGPGPNGPGRGGRPPPGRGPPMQRPPTADSARSGPYPPHGGGPRPGPGRGFPNGPGRGGRPVQFERASSSDPASSQSRPMDQPAPGGFGGAFPAFPGQQRRTDLDEETQITNQMAGMDMNNRPRMGPPNGSADAQRSRMRSPEGDYGRPPMDGARGPPRGYPPQGYPDQRRGPGPDAGYGADYRDDGYGPAPGPPGPRGDDFGPPARSMTMPVNDQMQRRNPGPPPRMDSAPYSGPPGRGMPPRPSTGHSARLPPQRSYPPNQGPPPPGAGYGGSDFDSGPQGYQQNRASFDDVLDSYYAPSRMSNPEFGVRKPQSLHSDVPDFGPGQQTQPRGSFDQNMRPGVPDYPQPGPRRTPELSRTKSQPDLRQPQTAVFEMAADIPPMPAMNGAQQGYAQDAYNGPNGWQSQQGRGGPGGPPNNPVMMRPGGGLPLGPSPPQTGNPDALPSHPTPVRPGLMPNSVVNMNNKPAPVRHYNGTPPGAGAPPLQQQPAQQQALQQQSKPPSFTQATIPVTPDELERLRVIIKADPNDQESALRLAKRLVEAADVLVAGLPDPKTRGRARERYLMDASKILKKLANAQNPDAMFIYADSLGKGLFGAVPDNKEAFTLYQSAAKLGHSAAAYRTAVCCEIGNEDGGTRKDPRKAIQWYRRAAALGDTPAMYKLGMILLGGLLDQPKNPREGVSWLKRAAERADPEYPHALHELGLLYESATPNDAILRDEAYAFQLFKQAAEMGYKFSQFRLGCTYEYGLLGCPIDPRLSIMWYSRAATQEEHQAELALSGWYLTGSEGTLQQSDTEAYLWARKAALAGLAKAEYAMGYFTEVGIGVPASMEDAKRWYWRAAAQDFPKARERLEDLKRAGKNGPRQRERISRSKIGKQQEGECAVM